MSRPAFCELYFGKSDPAHEVMANSADFIRSYVDLNGAVEQVTSGEKTLILGPKGTGKSALGIYLQKTSGGNASHFYARLRNASSLPLAEIPQLKTGQPSGALRTYNAWKFILLCNYLDVALGDTEAKIANLADVKRILRELKHFGFIGDESGKSLLRISSTTYTIDKGSGGALFKDVSGQNVDIFTLTPYLERWAVSLRSPRRHLLILDGLDSIFLNDSRYDESLSGLAQASYDLNMKFRQTESTGSVVLLIRNDIFSRISLMLPDAHKMRDFAYDLDWRILSGAAGENAPLMTLVNRKAAQERGEGEDIQVLSYFPSQIRVGTRRGQPKMTSRLQYLLNLTRHTPRDILQLMEHTRLAAKSAGLTGPEALSESVIREGVLQYSAKYFVDAIRGEFAGYEGGRDEAEAALSALKLLPKAQFTRSDYRESLRQNSPGLEGKADAFLQLLFFAGALGNLFDSGADRYMVFYHRRNDVDLNVQGTLVLHNALTHAWSRSFGLRD